MARFDRLLGRGRRRLAPIAVAAVAVLVGAACEFNPQDFPGSAALSECAGVPATIGVGWSADDGFLGSTYYGTEGDDVVVITNGPVTFYGLGGNDRICVNDTALQSGDGWATLELLDHQGYGTVAIDAGDGNDVVANASNTHVLAELGSGNDVYSATANAVDMVSAGPGADWVRLGDGNDGLFYEPDGVGDVLGGGAGIDLLWYFADPPESLDWINFETIDLYCRRCWSN